MFNSKQKKARKEIELLLDDVQMNLENNYKDSAIDARKIAVDRLEQSYKTGELTEKDYVKLKERLDGYTKRMEGYSHRLNVRF